MTHVDLRGVICPSRITRVHLKTLPYMPHGREMTMSSGLIYIYIYIGKRRFKIVSQQILNIRLD
jgi:hypothetical protein